ncbi:hypothetical protein CBS470a_006835 [Colletotrichum nupharicola]|nr:hypothetical protein CBS470a_006835 [Colletotrichum nupharicola]
MFLEIGIGMDLDALEPEFLDWNNQPTANTSYYTARKVFNEAKETNEYIAHFGRLIERCIDLDHFVKYARDDKGLRRAIETDIVNVLYSYYRDWGKDPDIDEAKPICVAKYSDKTHFLQDHAPSQSAKPSHLSCYNVSASNGTTFIRPMASEPVVKCVVDLKQQIILRSPTQDVRRVKIAILDTGVLKSFKRRVSEYKDFVLRDDSEFQDFTGHGTEAVSLITRIYPDAEIFIGRVFERSQATDDTAALMAEVNISAYPNLPSLLTSQAIMHAKTQWGAEIIIMASGFEDENAQLEHAIEEARHAGILIFAAASNFGDLKEIAFPARTYTELKLFCMFSTKPNVRDTCDFNPSQNACARHSFAILGEDIELPSMGGIMSLSGTSYSTMIGAAVAGLVLEFVRHPDTQGQIESGMRLRTVAGMSAVFSEMATRGGNGLDCIAPWKILPVHLRGEQVNIQAAREDIITTINRALRKR